MQHKVFWWSLPLVFLLASCAGDVGDIDRSQPGKLKKSLFTGEWFYRQTVVDVPYTVGVTFIGEQSYIDRVRWEISEDFLTAYRSYEKVTDSELPSQPSGTDYQGAPIAAYSILSHFDVVRQYNEATGEQTNVIDENTYDRPWYERDYIRVDWSTNHLANFDFVAGGGNGLGVRSQGSSYVVNDPQSPDAPVFAVKGAGSWTDYRDPMAFGELASIDYFDLTHKMQVTPDVFPIYYEDGGYEEWPACWFYEQGPWDCASQTIKIRASFLKVEESDYEKLDYPDNAIARDENGDAISLTYDLAQEGYRRCSSSDDAANCTKVRVPMFDRFGYFRTERETYDRDYGITEEGRQYHINRHNIWERSYDAQGNPLPYALRTVKPITYYLSPEFPEDLRLSAAEIAQWWNNAFVETVQGLQGNTSTTTVFQIADNSYRVDDGKIVDFGQRNGDLRYNHLYWVDNPQFESLLGYGPSGADPLSGEIVVADAYIYGAAIDTYASYGADIVDLMRGELSESDFIDGEHVGAAIAAMGSGSGESAQAVRQRLDGHMQKGLGTRLKNLRQRPMSDFRRQYDVVGARLDLAANDPTFAGLYTDEMRQALENRFGALPEISEFAAGRLFKALKRHRLGLAKRSIDMRSFEDSGVLALVNELQNETRENVIKKIRAYLFKSTGAHEIGHTLGLRHNFAGSTDALNFNDNYWSIRAEGAEALDLPTPTEEELGLRQYAYASIMDYSAKFSSDIRGLGKYDVAAIKFGYGQLVEVFDDAPTYADHDFLAYFTLEDAIKEWLHYTDLPELFESSPGAGDGRAQLSSRSNIPYSQVIAGMTLEPGSTDISETVVPYKFCSDEYAGATWDCDLYDEGADPYEIVNFAAQTYRDYYIFRAFKRHRRYLDPLEYYYGSYAYTMLPMSTQYQMWIYDQWNKTYEWEYLKDENINFVENSDWNLDKHGGLAAAAAAMSAMNFLAEVLATPEPGSYYQPTSSPDLLYWWTSAEDAICTDSQDSNVDNCSDAYIPLGEGRYAFSEYDAASGYYWYERLRLVGSFWDKLAAIETLADPTSNFLGVDDVADYSTYVLGFNVAFPNAVSQLFGSIVNDDYTSYAPRLSATGEVTIPDIFDSVSEAIGDEPAGSTSNVRYIEPATNFTVSLYTLFYGMALLNSNFDQSFNDGAKIWLEGSGEAFTPVGGTSTVEFANPINGRTYMAAESPNAKAYSLGYEMLTRANTLKNSISAVGADCFISEASECESVLSERYELEGLIENIEIVRGYYDVFGYSWF